MTSSEYVVEKFVAWSPGDPGEFQTRLNEFAQQGNELIACVEAAPGVLWIILRKDR